jgi:hypothetical protein
VQYWISIFIVAPVAAVGDILADFFGYAYS